MLSIFNHVYFKKTVNIICEFIPQLIFLTFLFGYLCFMVFYKWVRALCSLTYDFILWNHYGNKCAIIWVILLIICIVSMIWHVSYLVNDFSNHMCHVLSMIPRSHFCHVNDLPDLLQPHERVWFQRKMCAISSDSVHQHDAPHQDRTARGW